MCGIIGRIGKDNADISGYLAAINHRGPDSKGIFQDGNVLLGHTRLSIQDLSENGNQPMFSADGRYVIIFNGEIYNHWEIRESMLNDQIFRSTGDTETVLYACIRYGTSILNKLNGIFAFSLYDRHTGEILIARDHFGIKPLYFYHKDDYLIFSSEIKALLSGHIDKTVSLEALVNYLSFLWSPGEMTAFKFVKKLLPGHYLQFSTRSLPVDIQPVQYYFSSFNGQYSTASEETIIDELDTLLQAAVKRQMLADVPVGFFLSGGLDSTLLVAIARKLYPERNLLCFTIDVGDWDADGNNSENFTNDLDYARRAAVFLNVDLKEVKADINIIEDFDRMIWSLDEPQADAAPLNVLNIAKLARENGIKVLIGGTAGDDLFSGYRRHQALRYEKIFSGIPKSIGSLIKRFAYLLPTNTTFGRRLRKISANLDKNPVDRMKGYFEWLPISTVKKIFNPHSVSHISQYDPTNYFDSLLQEIPLEKNILNQMLFWELRTFLVDHNLNYTDKMTMAVGVEARVPYLDLELVSFSQKLPPELKMKNGVTKYILKKVAERYLPHDIIYRPKTGFGAPIRRWITQDLHAMIEDRLSPEKLDKRGIFNANEVWKLIHDNKAGKIDASYSIWSLLAIDSWLRQFVDVGNKFSVKK